MYMNEKNWWTLWKWRRTGQMLCFEKSTPLIQLTVREKGNFKMSYFRNRAFTQSLFGYCRYICFHSEWFTVRECCKCNRMWQKKLVLQLTTNDTHFQTIRVKAITNAFPHLWQFNHCKAKINVVSSAIIKFLLLFLGVITIRKKIEPKNFSHEEVHLHFDKRVI